MIGYCVERTTKYGRTLPGEPCERRAETLQEAKRRALEHARLLFRLYAKLTTVRILFRQECELCNGFGGGRTEDHPHCRSCAGTGGFWVSEGLFDREGIEESASLP